MISINGKQQETTSHELLHVFAGKWKTIGSIVTGDPKIRVSGEDNYEWMEGGFFLLHHTDVNINGDNVKAIEIMGYDANAGNFVFYSFNSQGNKEECKAVVENGIWTITGNDKRCTVMFNENKNIMIGKWEKLIDSTWVLWMNMELTKM